MRQERFNRYLIDVIPVDSPQIYNLNHGKIVPACFIIRYGDYCFGCLFIDILFYYRYSLFFRFRV